MKSKAIYLDVCALSRPFDDQRRMRTRLETVAVHLILSMVRAKRFELLSSPVHEKEIDAIPDVLERTELTAFLTYYAKPMSIDVNVVRARAEDLIKKGFGVADAAHIAFAEYGEADFVSCDDRLVKLCHKHDISVWTGNPILFCEKEGLS